MLILTEGKRVEDVLMPIGKVDEEDQWIFHIVEVTTRKMDGECTENASLVSGVMTGTVGPNAGDRQVLIQQTLMLTP